MPPIKSLGIGQYSWAKCSITGPAIYVSHKFTGKKLNFNAARESSASNLPVHQDNKIHSTSGNNQFNNMSTELQSSNAYLQYMQSIKISKYWNNNPKNKNQQKTY